MKKIISFIAVFILMALCPVLGSADDLIPAQKNFRSSIMQFLKEEGFSPYIDESDNTLCFKKEGTLYWVGISEDSPFYVEFHRNNVSTSDADKDIALIAALQTTKKAKCVKALNNENNVSIVIEMFCHSAEEFKYIFYRSLKELDRADEMLKDDYADLSGSSGMPFSFNSADISNVKRDGAVITSYGSTIYSKDTRYLKPRINLNVTTGGRYDIYTKMYNAAGALATGSNSPSGYSYMDTVTMESGNHSYELSGWGADTDGHWGKGTYRFEFYYNGNLIGSKSFTVK